MECEKSLIYVSDGPGFDAYVFAGWLVYSPFGAISMRKAGDFDPSSRMVGCACIKDLLIISHGMANGVHETGENVMVDWGTDELKEDINHRQISDRIVNLKFCKSCRIELRACQLGMSMILRSRLESTGCEVVLYKGLVNAWGWEYVEN